MLFHASGVKSSRLLPFFGSCEAFLLVSGIAHPIQFQNVVSEAHQGPFALHFGQPSKREPSEPAGLLDLSEHWFHNRFASCINGRPEFGLQLPAHAINARRSFGKRTARAFRSRLRMFLATRCYIGVYLLVGCGF